MALSGDGRFVELCEGAFAEPIDFAAYFDLLQPVLDDDVAGAAARVAAFDRYDDRTGRRPAKLLVRSAGDLPADVVETFLRQLNSDPTTRIVLTGLTEALADAAGGAVAAAMDLLAQAVPEVVEEINATLQHVILVAGRVNETLQFDGATSFGIWGALFLNAEEHTDRLEAIDGLSHESAHAVLFGRSLGTALVRNDPDERHPSPLRSEPRPLDGIFHATFVSARMHYAHMRLLSSGLLTTEEAERCRQMKAASAKAFQDGRATLGDHAVLTPLGATVLSAASAYMDGASD